MGGGGVGGGANTLSISPRPLSALGLIMGSRVDIAGDNQKPHVLLSHGQPAKAQVSLCICAVSPEPSLSALVKKYERRRRVRPNIRHLAPLYGCACAFEE